MKFAKPLIKMAFMCIENICCPQSCPQTWLDTPWRDLAKLPAGSVGCGMIAPGVLRRIARELEP